jgi:hypothetical protein
MADRTHLEIEKSYDQTLNVFGETVILRRDPLGSSLDASVIEEVVPPGVAGPWHRHSREDEVSYVVEGTFRIWRGEEPAQRRCAGVARLPRTDIHQRWSSRAALLAHSERVCRCLTAEGARVD